MSTVLVTGATGFVGSHLAAALWRRGHRVIGSTSAERRLPMNSTGVSTLIVLPLGESFARVAAVGAVDAVVHCAWAVHGATDANVSGTQRLAEEAADAGVQYQLFISTYSAHPQAVTEYGRSKLHVERRMRQGGHAAARLGLVIGPGGIFRRIADTVAQHRVVPLIDGGRTRIPIVGIADLSDALAQIVERRVIATLNLYDPQPVLLRDVVAEIRARSGRRTMLVSVPAGALLWPLRLAQRLGVTLPLDADNVRALRANADCCDPSNLPDFVREPLSLRAMIDAAMADASEGPRA